MSISLTAEAILDSASLHVRYQVENGGQDEVCLVNVISRWTAAGLSTGSDNVYTEVVDGELRITKANLPVPEHLDVESPDVPLLTRVHADAVFSEGITLPLPLDPYHPYDGVERTEELVTYEDVALVSGWLPARVSIRTGQRPDGTEVTSADYPDVPQEQRLLMTTLPVSVPTHLSPTVGT